MHTHFGNQLSKAEILVLISLFFFFAWFPKVFVIILFICLLFFSPLRNFWTCWLVSAICDKQTSQKIWNSREVFEQWFLRRGVKLQEWLTFVLSSCLVYAHTYCLGSQPMDAACHPLLLFVMVLGREPGTTKKWEECGLRKVVQSTRGGTWIRAVRKCRHAGNTVLWNSPSFFWLI